MKHFWIFEVLLDLRSYAQANGLTRLVAKVDEALVVAHMEIDPKDQGGDPTAAS